MYPNEDQVHGSVSIDRCEPNTLNHPTHEAAGVVAAADEAAGAVVPAGAAEVAAAAVVTAAAVVAPVAGLLAAEADPPKGVLAPRQAADVPAWMTTACE